MKKKEKKKNKGYWERKSSVSVRERFHTSLPAGAKQLVAAKMGTSNLIISVAITCNPRLTVPVEERWSHRKCFQPQIQL